MAYCEILTSRVRDELIDYEFYSEKRMFGSKVFLLSGKMVCAVTGDDMIVRVGPVVYEECLAKDYVRTFNMKGRPTKGWVIVDGDQLLNRDDLLEWINKGISFCLSLSS
ncbi:MAG: RNA methyltransferase [Denitrovibrio sp.]|nr:MAG: RNA methyltransferase [Denitrovibrio sp.]